MWRESTAHKEFQVSKSASKSIWGVGQEQRKGEQGPFHIVLQEVGFTLGATWSRQTGGNKEVIWVRFTFE